MGLSTAERSRRYHARKRAEYIAQHGHPPQVGGNRRPQSFKHCEGCGVWFGPLETLKQRFCSIACKFEWREPGSPTVRRTITKARSAQSLLAYHVKAGHLIRPAACEECGAGDRRIEAAHRDYDRPLDVRWLCRSCHVKWDRAEPKGATVILARWEQATGCEAVRL